MAAAHLTVESKALFATLRKVLPHLRRRKLLEAVLSFDGEHLLVEFQGAQYGARASGEWKGTVRVSLAMLEAIARSYESEPLAFEYRDGKLRIGSTSVAARWQDLPAKFLELSIDSPEGDLLAICMAAPEARVIASGLGPRFEDAKRRLGQRLDAVATALAPYGDFREPIEKLVHEELERRGRKG